MITWWQALIMFTVYGVGARVDEKLSQESEFKHGAGLFMRFVVNTAFVVGAWLLLDAWAGITW